MRLAWKQLIVALVLGGCLGFFGAAASLPRLFHHRWESGQFQHRLLEQFSSKLKLTPEQRTHIAAILEAKRQKIDALRAEIRPRFEEIRTSTGAEIRQLLTPEQQRKFDVMQAKWEARTKRFHHQWMGPDGK